MSKKTGIRKFVTLIVAMVFLLGFAGQTACLGAVSTVSANVTTATIQLPVVPDNAPLPARFSWVDYGVVTTPKNQEPYGLCWDFATIGALETQIAIHSGQTVDLSEATLFRETFSNINMALDSATSLKVAANGGNDVKTGAEALIRYGVPFEDCFPYTEENVIGNGSYTHCPIVYRAGVIRFVAQTESATNGSTEKIKRALLEHGPLMADILPPPYRYTSTVIESTNEEGGHEVLLIGWDDNLGAWQIKNSWGPQWGWQQNGFAYIK